VTPAVLSQAIPRHRGTSERRPCDFFLSPHRQVRTARPEDEPVARCAPTGCGASRSRRSASSRVVRSSCELCGRTRRPPCRTESVRVPTPGGRRRRPSGGRRRYSASGSTSRKSSIAAGDVSAKPWPRLGFSPVSDACGTAEATSHAADSGNRPRVDSLGLCAGEKIKAEPFAPRTQRPSIHRRCEEDVSHGPDRHGRLAAAARPQLATTRRGIMVT